MFQGRERAGTLGWPWVPPLWEPCCWTMKLNRPYDRRADNWKSEECVHCSVACLDAAHDQLLSSGTHLLLKLLLWSQGEGSCQGTGIIRPIFRRRCGWLIRCSWLPGAANQRSIVRCWGWAIPRQLLLMCKMTPVLGRLLLRNDPWIMQKKKNKNKKKNKTWFLGHTSHWMMAKDKKGPISHIILIPENPSLTHPFHRWRKWGPESWNYVLRFLNYLWLNGISKQISWSSHCGSAEANLTSTHKDSGSIPGLAQWVKHPVLPWPVV